MKLRTKILCRAFIVLLAVITYLPILILILFSFTKTKTLGDWSSFKWSGENYSRLFTESSILTAVGNTFLIAGVSAVLATVLGTAAAVGLFYGRRFLRKILGAASQITMINADIVTAIAFVVFFAAVMGHLDGIPALLIAHTVITLPYVVLSVTPRLTQLDPNLYEAGLDLGAGHLRTLLTVLLPQLIPGMIAGFGLAFTLSLDDYVLSNFLSGTGFNTISTLIYAQTKHGIDTAFRALSALMFIMILAVLLLLNIFAKRKGAGKDKTRISLPPMIG